MFNQVIQTHPHYNINIQGDKLGMEISREGTLQFLVNDRSQGAAATNVYSTDKLVYGFVDHYGQAVTSTIAEGKF